jgi:hypothetical protein
MAPTSLDPIETQAQRKASNSMQVVKGIARKVRQAPDEAEGTSYLLGA